MSGLPTRLEPAISPDGRILLIHPATGVPVAVLSADGGLKLATELIDAVREARTATPANGMPAVGGR